MKAALTIAGSDSSAGAGIQADLKTFHAHGIYGVTAITAVTVQNTQKVFNTEQIRPSIVHDQIVCLFDDMDLHAVKIGMTADVEIIESIATALRKVALPPVVLDPVMISTSGYPLLAPRARKALIERLFPLAEVITPNINEAEALIGETISTVEAMKTAALKIARFGARKVVLKGGHLDGSHATDILFDGETLREIKRKRIKTRHTHGTGCTFSSAIAANLACGHDFFAAVENAKNYVTDAIAHAISIGKGYGPTHHFYHLYTQAGINIDD
jgi:hydroxymethylpyrimidine/phosphomethylpyrimidine kinase